MSINWKAILGEEPYRVIIKKQPDGTWMAWLDQAPTSFAIAETHKKAVVDLLTICFGTVRPDEKKDDEENES